MKRPRNVRRVSTVGMPRAEWLEVRRQTIGGSEASAIVGLSKWASPLSVWAEKLEKVEDKTETGGMRMVRDLEQAEKLGLEIYITQLEERRAILDRLLEDYNDGRRKSFYSLAVYLLELDSLRRAFDEIQEAVPANSSIKEKAITAVEILKKAAEIDGVVLKLNKKPKEK